MMPTASAQNVQAGAMCATSQAKFIPKKPVKRQRQKERGEHRQPRDPQVQPVRHGREVDVHRPGEEVAVAIDQIADPDQVVVDVAEVVALVELERRQSS